MPPAFPQPPRTSERLSPSERPIPRITDGGKSAAVAALGRGLSSFFGQLQSTIGDIVDSQIAVEKTEIEIDRQIRLADAEVTNRRQKAEATALALRGEALTPEQRTDLDYTETYATVLGSRLGAEVGAQAAVGLQTLPTDEDPVAFIESFLGDSLANGSGGIGTGDPVFDAYFLKAFRDTTETAVSQHRLAGAKAQLARGIEHFEAAVAANVRSGTIEAGDLPRMIEAARTLNPRDPEKAPSIVLGAVLAGAQNDPNLLDRVSTLLTQPGSGDAERSFMEVFPAAFDRISGQLAERARSVRGLQAQKQYDSIEEAIRRSNDLGEVTRLVAPGGELDKAFFTHGGSDRWLSLVGLGQSRMSALAKQIVDFNAVAAMTNGALAPDVSLLRKTQPAFLTHLGIDPWNVLDVERGSAAAAHVVLKQGIISEDLRVPLSSALVSGASPDRFAASMTFYGAIESASTEKRALEMMDEAARPVYLHAKRVLQDTAKPLPEIFADLQGDKSSLPAVASAKWAPIVGTKTEPEATTKIRDRIRDALEDVLGTSVHVPEATLQELTESAKFIHMGRKKGLGDWRESVEDAVKAAAPSFHPVPGADGALVAERGLRPRVVPKLDANGLPVIEDGKPVPQTLVPFGRSVWNAVAGTHEDTVKTWEKDAKVLRQLLPTAKGIDAPMLDAVNHWTARHGVYLIRKEDGDHLLFGLGTKLNLGGETVTIPSDPSAAAEFARGLQDRLAALPEEDRAALLAMRERASPGDTAPLPLTQRNVLPGISDRLVLIPYPQDGSLGFLAGYRPGFVSDPLPTLAERRAARAEADAEAVMLPPVPEPPPPASGFRTEATEPAQAMQELVEWVAGVQRSLGRAAPSVGITAPIPPVPAEPQKGASVMDRIGRGLSHLFSEASKWAQENIMNRKGTSYDDPSAHPKDTYGQRRYDFLAASEGIRSQVYDDATGKTLYRGSEAKGKRTVGLGFNLDRPDAAVVFTAATGLSLADFRAVYEGRRKLSPVEVRQLFDWTVQEAEDVIDHAFPPSKVPLREHQRLALVSLAFNHPALIGPNLQAAVKSGDFTAAREEILWRSNAKRHPGIAARRYREASMFAGPADSATALPAYPEYINTVRG